MWLRFKNLMLWCHSSLRQPKRRIVVLLIVKESFPLWQWAFSGRKRRGRGHLLPVMLSTSRCIRYWNLGGLFTFLYITVLLLTLCFCSGWKLIWIIPTCFLFILLETSFMSRGLCWQICFLVVQSSTATHQWKGGHDKKIVSKTHCHTSQPLARFPPQFPLFLFHHAHPDYTPCS